MAHVRPGAVGGDGTRERPFGTLARAVEAVSAGGTVALHRGEHRVEAAVTLRAGVVLVGVGPVAGSTLVVSHGHAGVTVAEGAGGVALRDLAVRYEGGAAGPADAAVDVAAGASVSLRNVSIDGAYDGLRSLGVVDAERLSVLRAARNGIALRGSAVGRFRSLLVRDGAYQGVAAGPQEGGAATPAARVHITGGAILRNAQRGINLFGAPAPGSGAARCTLDGPTGEGGDLDCLARVSVQWNGVHALGVRGARRVEGRLLSLSGTRAAEGAPDADGLSLTEGGRMALDPEVVGDASMGHGSVLAGNARAGLLAQGAGVEVAVAGARVASNDGPGIFIASGASAPSIGFSRVVGNGAVGLAVTGTASVAMIQCNSIGATRAAPLVTRAGATPALGDGLSVNQGGGPTVIVANVLDGNARFGAVFNAARGTFERNRGDGNGYRVRAYGSPMLTLLGAEAVRGRVEGPAELPAMAGDP